MAKLPDFTDLKVAVLGDGIADHYVSAVPTRPSREAPVLVFQHTREELRPGGAANVARNVSRLGARGMSFGVVGGDEPGLDLRSVLAIDYVDISALVVAARWQTPTKMRVLAGDAHRTPQQVLRLDREPQGPPPEDALSQVEAALERAADDLDALIISDYGYGGVDEGGLRIAQSLAERGVPVVIDPRDRFSLIESPTALTPNLDELARFAGVRSEDLMAPRLLVEVAEDLRSRSGAAWILATLGNRGMALIGPDQQYYEVDVHGMDDAVDVSGAGDTAAAVFTLGLAAGSHPREAMEMANAAAGLVVMEQGTSALTRNELRAAFEETARSRELALEGQSGEMQRTERRG